MQLLTESYSQGTAGGEVMKPRNTPTTPRRRATEETAASQAAAKEEETAGEQGQSGGIQAGKAGGAALAVV